MRGQGVWLLIVMMALGSMTVSSCSTESRYGLLSTIFEDVPKPGAEASPKPMVRHARRPPYTPPAPPVMVKLAPPPPKPDWLDLLKKLPKEEAGGVDWDAAVDKGLISPKYGTEPDATEQAPFDLTLELVPEGQPTFTATFPHKQHTEWLTCNNCHTAIFQMQKGADPITMEKIYAGEYCGRCHGKVSYAVPTGCPRCHKALQGPK